MLPRGSWMGEGLRSAGPQSGALRLHCCRQPTTPISYLAGLPHLQLRCHLLNRQSYSLFPLCSCNIFFRPLLSRGCVNMWFSLSHPLKTSRLCGEQLYLMFPVSAVPVHMEWQWCLEYEWTNGLPTWKTPRVVVFHMLIANYHVEDGELYDMQCGAVLNIHTNG